VRWVRNENWASTDMLRSVQLGAAALGACSAFFLLPGDMPFVAPETFAALLAERERQRAMVIFPTHSGRRGHPPLIDAALLPAILGYDGPEGLRGLWRRYKTEVRIVSVRDSGIAQDLDTQEDYQRLKNT
jgi:CTP:molybdopterin cytidylyltransferase MocA